MPEMFRATEIIYNRPELRASIALVTDGRFSGAILGPAIGNVTPEAATGGPLAFVEDDDLMSIDIPGQSLEIVGFDSKHQELEAVERKLRERKRHGKVLIKSPKACWGCSQNGRRHAIWCVHVGKI